MSLLQKTSPSKIPAFPRQGGRRKNAPHCKATGRDLCYDDDIYSCLTILVEGED